MDKFSISVVIAAKNAESTISQAIQSVLNGVEIPLEILVVDDNSEDLTGKIAAGFDKVRVIKGRGLGSGPARNLAISSAFGEYIAFLDADDVWHPEKLLSQSRLMSPTTIVGCWAKYESINGIYLGSSPKLPAAIDPTKDFASGGDLPAVLSSWIVPRSALIACGLFDGSFTFAQDFDLAHRLVQSGMRFSVVREELISYRIHGDSSTARSYVEQFLSAQYVRLRQTSNVSESLTEWLGSESATKKYRRAAKSGWLVRRALLAYTSRQYLPALGSLIYAAALDFKRVLQKISKQAPKRRGNEI